jgi:hypothetical protein
MSCLAPSVALCLLVVSPAHAQVVTEPARSAAIERDSPAAPPRIEIGAQGAVTAFLGGGGAFLPGAGARLTINVTRLDALELVGDIVPSIENPGMWGLYSIQYKRVVRPGDRRRNAIFATASTSGLFRYYRTVEYRQPRSDGSTLVRPSYRYAELTRPLFFGGGVGVEGVVARYAAVRAEVQGLVGFVGVVGFRTVVGLSVPIGGYDAATR